MVVDFHTHTFPERIAAFAIDKLKKACHTPAYTDGTASCLRASMHRAGIDYSVVLPVVTNPLKTSGINDASIELTGKDGLIYFGGIHPDTPDVSAELKRIADAGIKGVKIHPVYQDTHIDDIRYLRILDKAAELGLTVVMHAGDDIGFPGRVCCSPEMTRSAVRQVGPVRLVCAHMGGWRNWQRVADALADTSVMLDTALSFGMLEQLEPDYYSEEELSLMSETTFCQLLQAFGAQRVVFGSDSPWSDQAASAAAIMKLPLTQEEKSAVLGENARRLLNL